MRYLIEFMKRLENKLDDGKTSWGKIELTTMIRELYRSYLEEVLLEFQKELGEE